MIKLKDNLCIIVGPTSIGKSDLGVNLAIKHNGEVISADSMLIYKHMDLGTAKVRKDEMKGIPHHMIDIISPVEGFTVSDIKYMAKSHIGEINEKGKLPIVVGGTGLYVNSLVYNLDFAEIPPNEDLRSEYESLIEQFGNEYLHERLMKIDPISGEKISLKDKKRTMRALEIYDSTGKTMSEHNKNFRVMNEDYNLVYIALNMDRSQLYERINHRVDVMFESGLVEEVKSILEMGYSPDLVALKAIGYKEIIMYLENQITLEEAIELIKKGSRNYAKRQLTWFRRDKRIKWINIDEYDNNIDVCNHISNYIVENLTID